MELKQLTDAYRQRMETYYRTIEQTCASRINGQKINLPLSPSYLAEVILPVLHSLAKNMPGYKIKIPDPKTYFPIKGYYRVKVGITTVGGFSVPDGSDFSLYFTPMWYAKPTAERIKIDNTEVLIQLIINQLKTD